MIPNIQFTIPSYEQIVSAVKEEYKWIEANKVDAVVLAILAASSICINENPLQAIGLLIAGGATRFMFQKYPRSVAIATISVVFSAYMGGCNMPSVKEIQDLIENMPLSLRQKFISFWAGSIIIGSRNDLQGRMLRLNPPAVERL